MIVSFRQSDRLLGLPPYIFSEINAIKAEAQKKGVQLLSLAIGDPDLPTPQPILDALHQASLKAENHAYSPYEGTLAFRKAVAEWFQGRFGATLNPESEVLALIGSKEGLAHFPLAFCNPGDRCLVPSPGYPIFSTSIQLAGAIAVPVPLRAQNGFLPDVKELERLMIQHQPKYLLLNFPSNPTSATCSRDLLMEVVALAKRHNVILGYDNAYSEMYFDTPPLSLMEIPGAKDIGIEFHSFSKTFNMTGWRLGFAVGNPSLIAGLARVKTNIDSGPLLAVQEAGIFALKNHNALVTPLREIYRERRELALAGLRDLGIEYFKPEATFFVWAKVPKEMSSMAFTKELIAAEGLVVTPGIGFGEHGEGFFRLSLTVSNAAIKEAIEKLRRYLATL